MKTKSLKFAGLLSTAIVAPAFFAAPASAQYVNKATTAQIAKLQNETVARRVSDTLDRVKLWNEVMLQANLIDHSTGQGQLGPARNSRAFAMVSIAVFDAVNAFNGKFRSYNPIAPALRGASKDAAIAQAAYTVLRALHPAQTVRIDGIFVSDLSQINASPSAIAAGRAIGEASAQAMLARRSNDGSQAPEPLLGAGGTLARGATLDVRGNPVNSNQTAAPNWAQDPIAQQPTALGARWGNVTTFVMRTGDQFRTAPVPAVNTARYRAGYNDVARRGADFGIPGSTHDSRQSFIGNFWGYDGQPLLGTPPRLYNQIAISIAEDQALRNVDNFARMLAIVNSSLGDSGIGAWDSKYFHNYWRPVTGVRRGAEDGDPTTAAIPNYRPFGLSILNNTAFRGLPRERQTITPNFPAYPSGHATFGATMFESLRAFFPNNTRFTFVSDEYNGFGEDVKSGEPVRAFVPVRYRSFQEAQEENGDSRIANGVHWEWDDTEGQTMGVNIARFTIANAFQRR